MKNRGPDNQNYKLYRVFDLNLYMFAFKIEYN